MKSLAKLFRNAFCILLEADQIIIWINHCRHCRKNDTHQHIADTVEGAMASAILYSIIETAKANGLEPYWYLRFLLEKAPGLKSKEDFRNLIPQNVDRQLIINLQQSHINAGITPA